MSELNHKILDVKILIDDIRTPIDPLSGALVIRESMNFLAPTAKIYFTDNFTAFLAGKPILQDNIFTITFQDDDSSKELKMYPFQDNVDPTESQDDSHFHSLDLISKWAPLLMLDYAYESFEGKASDVVKKLAIRLGLKSDVEETLNSRVWIRPGWKASQWLRYLATNSISVNGSSGYVYYVTFDGVLVFKSIDKFFDTNEVEKIVVNPDSLDTPNMKLKADMLSSVILGANNLKMNYYDLTKGEMVNEEVKYNQNIKKRAQFSGVSSKLSDKGKFKYMGEFQSSEMSKPSSAYKEIFIKSTLLSEMTTVKLTVKANPFGRKLGSIIDLSLPSSNESRVNLNYSGRYMVKSIATKGNREYWQTLELIRPGINLNNRSTIL